MKEHIFQIKDDLAEIKADLKEHMRRTEAAEQKLDPMWKAYVGVKWSFGAIIGLAALLTALAKIKGYL